MGGPEDARLPPRKRFRGLPLERPVPAPRVDSHDPDALIEEPAGGLRRDGTTAPDVVGLAVVSVSPRPEEYNIQRLEDGAGLSQSPSQILDFNALAVGLLGHVDDHAIAEEPCERQFVDAGRSLALDRAVVVPGSVDVSDVVRPQAAEFFDGPAFPVPEPLGRYVKQGLDLC